MLLGSHVGVTGHVEMYVIYSVDQKRALASALNKYGLQSDSQSRLGYDYADWSVSLIFCVL